MDDLTLGINPDLEIGRAGLIRHVQQVRGLSEQQIEGLYVRANKLIPEVDIESDARAAAETLETDKDILQASGLTGLPRKQVRGILYAAITSYLIEERRNLGSLLS